MPSKLKTPLPSPLPQYWGALSVRAAAVGRPRQPSFTCWSSTARTRRTRSVCIRGDGTPERAVLDGHDRVYRPEQPYRAQTSIRHGTTRTAGRERTPSGRSAPSSPKTICTPSPARSASTPPSPPRDRSAPDPPTFSTTMPTHCPFPLHLLFAALLLRPPPSALLSGRQAMLHYSGAYYLFASHLSGLGTNPARILRCKAATLANCCAPPGAPTKWQVCCLPCAAFTAARLSLSCSPITCQ